MRHYSEYEVASLPSLGCTDSRAQAIKPMGLGSRGLAHGGRASVGRKSQTSLPRILVGQGRHSRVAHARRHPRVRQLGQRPGPDRRVDRDARARSDLRRRADPSVPGCPVERGARRVAGPPQSMAFHLKRRRPGNATFTRKRGAPSSARWSFSLETGTLCSRWRAGRGGTYRRAGSTRPMRSKSLALLVMRRTPDRVPLRRSSSH